MGLSKTFLVRLVILSTILMSVRTDAIRRNTVQSWRATLKLGEAENGGTDSPINIKLYDEDGFQETVTLNKLGFPLRRGMTLSFRFLTGFLGKLSNIELFLNISQNPWHLETFQLDNMDTAQNYKFRIGRFSTKEAFNVPQDKVKLWRIQIQVGASRDAGTRGMVKIRLHGSRATSDTIHLRSPYHREFIPGETVDFYFSTKDIGQLRWAQMIVGQWDLMYLERILIMDIDESKMFAFDYSGFVMNETFYCNEQNGAYTPDRSPDFIDGNPDAKPTVILMTKLPTKQTHTARIVRPEPNTSKAKTTTTARTTRTRRMTTSKSTIVKPIRKHFVFDSKRPPTTSQQRKSRTSIATPRIQVSSRKAPVKETRDADIWDSILGDSQPDSFGVGTTTARKFPFQHLAERKRENLGSDDKFGNAHVWEPRRATSVSWRPTTETIAVRKSFRRPVKVTTLNGNKQNTIRLTSSKVSTIDRSSSDAVVPIADINLPTGRSGSENRQVMPKSTQQGSQGSRVNINVAKDQYGNIYPVTNTGGSFLDATARPASNFESRSKIESMTSSKFLGSTDTGPGSIEGTSSQRNRGPAGHRSNAVVGPFENKAWHQLGSEDDPNQNSPELLGKRSKVDNIPPGTNVPQAGQHNKGDVSRTSPGVNTLMSGADHLGPTEEGLGFDPVPTLESITDNRPTPGRPAHTMKAHNANNGRNLSPDNDRERQIKDWNPSLSNSDNIGMKRSRLSGERSNQVSRQNKVERGPFESKPIGLENSKTDRLPGSRDSGFKPGLFKDTTIIPTPTEISEKVDDCHLASYKEDERYYLEEVTGFTSVIRPCPIGTVFRKNNCACTAPEKGAQQSSKCHVEFELDFVHGIKDSSGKNVFAPSKNVVVHESSGRFEGNSEISLWRFQQAEFGDKVTIHLKFKQDDSQSEVQQLVGNCVPKGEPSLSISIDQRSAKIMYRIVTHLYSETIEATYNTDKWNEVTLAYNGRTMRSITNGVQKKINLEGKIEKRGSPLRFGSCETTHGFRGLFDNIQIYMCVPEKEHGTGP